MLVFHCLVSEVLLKRHIHTASLLRRSLSQVPSLVTPSSCNSNATWTWLLWKQLLLHRVSAVRLALLEHFLPLGGFWKLIFDVTPSASYGEGASERWAVSIALLFGAMANLKETRLVATAIGEGLTVVLGSAVLGDAEITKL